MSRIKKFYTFLYREYGKQGWWPVCRQQNAEGRMFEICIGAILTQNTAWKNVEKAILNLRKLNAINPKKILKLKDEKIKEAIRPAGYYNQKARKLKEFSKFFLSLEGRVPKREELLSVWGIGKETADSILLYAFKIPVFVVDAYTKRILVCCGIISQSSDYDEIQRLFMENLENDAELFNEYHALLVEHAKRHYSKKPYGKDCPLKKIK